MINTAFLLIGFGFAMGIAFMSVIGIIAINKAIKDLKDIY